MKKFFTISFAFVCLLVSLTSCSPREQEAVKPRVIVTCDPELDDNNSLIRYLLFSDGFDTEGIIYASSQYHWRGDGQGTTQYLPGREYSRGDRDLGPQTHWRWAEGERFIDANVDAYEQVYPNLKAQNPDFPTPEYIKSIVRFGNVNFEGDMAEDTPGSDLIKQVLLDDDDRPVFLQVWGGPSTVARALKSIEDEYASSPDYESIKAKVSAKAILCLSGLQDQTYNDYIKPNWPDVRTNVKNSGVTVLAYGAKRSVRDQSDTLYFSPEWTAEYILGKGPLSARYRVWGDGQQMAPNDFTDYFGESGKSMEELVAEGYWVWTPPLPKGNFISEGDTPEYLNLIGNGLRAWCDERWGGWAGRWVKSEQDPREGSFMASYSRGRNDEVLPDFIPAIQNNFAGRMAWCTTDDFSAVNHEPVVRGALDVSASPGQTVKLRTDVSDPDGDQLVCQWAHWKIQDAYQGDIEIADATSASTTVNIPDDAVSGDVFHLILTVSDSGTPSMTSYLRTVITVK